MDYNGPANYFEDLGDSMSETPQSPGEALASARKAASMTQAQVAEKLNEALDGSYSQPVIARIESGRRTLTVPELIAFSEVIGAQPEYIITQVRHLPIEKQIEEKAAELAELSAQIKNVKDKYDTIIKETSSLYSKKYRDAAQGSSLLPNFRDSQFVGISQNLNIAKRRMCFWIDMAYSLIIDIADQADIDHGSVPFNIDQLIPMMEERENSTYYD